MLLHPLDFAYSKAVETNEHKDALMISGSRGAESHGTKMIFLHDNLPPAVMFGKLSDDRIA
jgi:hypothetical protein